MEQVAKENPFAEEPGARVAAIFLEAAPPKTTIEETRGLADERLVLGRREIYVHYPRSAGPSSGRADRIPKWRI